MGTVQLDGYLLKYSPSKGKVKIGGRVYPVVQIGNQLWMAENLDYKFDGLVVGQSGTSRDENRANYYDNDEATYGASGNKYGLLYNQIAAIYLNNNRQSLLPEGWRVPSKSDFNALENFIGSLNAAYIKSSTGWYDDGNGTDDFGFSLYPSGMYGSGGFEKLGTQGYLWSSYEYNTNSYSWYCTYDSDLFTYTNYYGASRQMAIRLVKDAS